MDKLKFVGPSSRIELLLMKKIKHITTTISTITTTAIYKK